MAALLASQPDRRDPVQDHQEWMTTTHVVMVDRLRDIREEVWVALSDPKRNQDVGMREHRSGRIISVTSMGGKIGTPVAAGNTRPSLRSRRNQGASP
jgi:hypothetical protein